MRTIAAVRLLSLLALVSAAACSDDDDSPAAPAPERFSASLSGSNEVPPNTTAANGSATMEAVGDTAVSYTVTATGLSGLTQGHIHVGGAGVNGGVVVWLLPPNGTAPQPPSGPLSGTIASGRFNASNIRGVGGQPAISLDSLKRLMRTGNAYVNFHTSTFAGGEIRGQVRTN